MNHIKEIICPCGELLLRTSGGGSGLKTCFKCGQMIHFDITENGVRVRVEDREALLARPGCLTAARCETERFFEDRAFDEGEPEE